MSYPQTMNREVFHEGWLIKSPPTKRIWRARWRRRWFTLKQGEIPGQYCLEYYTDRSCRKLKGIIDLDQCEQVDCGLRLEHRKQKFQYMFDVKTPRRTFYLAAESEVDMHDWVNCICQVCNLQDLTKQQAVYDRQYYNVGLDREEPLPPPPPPAAAAIEVRPAETNATTASPERQSAYQNDEFIGRRASAAGQRDEYSNRETVLCTGNVIFDGRTDYYNFSSVAAELLDSSQNSGSSTQFERSQSMSVPSTKAMLQQLPAAAAAAAATPPAAPPRPRSLADPHRTTSTGRRIPDQLTLTNTILGAAAAAATAPTPLHSDDLSPALSTASGPYIAISECFTGGVASLLLPPQSGGSTDPTTPLNSLDPRFYDLPRSRHTIGLNLTAEQPYSPKRTNVALAVAPGISALAAASSAQQQQQQQQHTKNGRSSPSDEESVFTDDEEWPTRAAATASSPTAAAAAESPAGGGDAVQQRQARPSDSSVENDSMAYTYTQRFSKMPNGGSASGAAAAAGAAETAEASGSAMARTLKAVVEPWIEASAFGSAEALEAGGGEELAEAAGGNSAAAAAAHSREMAQQLQMSDTENASPAIGPKDHSSSVEENYDIPRSHQHPYYRSRPPLSPSGLCTPTTAVIGGGSLLLATSTPNLMAADGHGAASGTGTVGRQRHFYTNAAPTNLEGNVFRYDFVEQENAPLVNRGLKPKPSALGGDEHQQQRPNSSLSTASNTLRPTRRTVNPPAPAAAAATPISLQPVPPPPNIDRKLKPSANALGDTAAPTGDGLSPKSGAFASQTLPRNYNHSAASAAAAAAAAGRHPLGHIRSNSTALPMSSTAAGGGFASGPATGRPMPQLQPMLDYLELDTSAGGAGALVNAVTAGAGAQSAKLGGKKADALLKAVGGEAAAGSSTAAGGGSGATAGAAAAGGGSSESSIVYKSVDFIKTEAIKRTRQDRAHKTSNGGAD